MADIDSIISGVGGNTRADVSGLLSDIPKYYAEGKERKYIQEGRDLFKEGVPRNRDGSLNYSAMRDALFSRGDVGQGMALDNLDLQRQRLKFGMDAASQDFPVNGPPSPQQPPVSPPSTSRDGGKPVAPPLNRGGSAAPQAGGGTTLMQVLSAQGIPNDQLGAATASIGRQLGIEDPNAPIDVNDQRVRNVLVPAIQMMKRGGIGQVAAPTAPAMQQAPQPQSFDARFNEATTNGLVPAGRTPQQQLELLTRRVASGLLAPEVAKVYETRIKALQDAIAPTPDMKNAAASGMPVRDFLDRGDENQTQRAILTNSVLPKLDKSQEAASAARDDINSIHSARTELDRPGGVFSGAFAEHKQYLAKVASALGIADTDKIATTEAYGAAIGQRVASMVKAFGTGNAISDGDRKFAAAMAGGQITLDERSMRRILDIGEKASRLKIGQHNSLVGRTLEANEALKGQGAVYEVQAPGEYKKATQASNAGHPEGTIAVNPQTGEQIRKVNGKWVPFS